MRAIIDYIRARLQLLPVVEGLVLFLSMTAGYELRLIDQEGVLPTFQGLIFAALMLFSMTALGLYQERDDPFRLIAQRVLMAYLMSLALLGVLFYWVPEALVGRGIFAIASMVALSGILLVRWVADYQTRVTSPSRRLLIIGTQQDADDILLTLRKHNSRTSGRFATLDPLPSLVPEHEFSRLHEPHELMKIVRERGYTEIVVGSHDQRKSPIPMRSLLECRVHGIPVWDLVSFFERELGLVRLGNLRASWLVFGPGFEQSTLRRTAKRLFDLIASIVLLILTAPIMALTALLIMIEDGRPVLFIQERCGQGGQPFRIYKFRSMRRKPVGAGPSWAAQDQDRITRVGRIIRKIRVDELPQLFNVLLGNMSFVGPRPEQPYFVDKLAESIPFYELRHNVKPGITGWAQVSLPYAASVEESREKLEYDLYYVKNHSVVFDLIILFETVQVILLRKGS
ncbi:MAG: TIGR03013 family PEP-CTERM/XrtA system glycosyltransferase [Burkholderiaceae bacterium]